MASASASDKTLTHCKKCNEVHDKPVNNKCERFKASKEEKRDVSRESATKKTPKHKAPADAGQGDKMLDLILHTMSSFTDKLSAMEAQISGLTSRMNTESSVTPTRKSRSREKTKRPDTLDTSEERGGLFSSGMKSDLPTVHSDRTSLFTQTFPDTAVTFKSNPTPARAKKPKPDLDLGVKPLESTVQKSLCYKPTHDNSTLPRVTSTITRPVSTSVMSWDSIAH